MTGWVKRNFLAVYLGLEVFATNDAILIAVVRQKLTQALRGLTALLSEEADFLLNEELGTVDAKTTLPLPVPHTETLLLYHIYRLGKYISFIKLAQSVAARLLALVIFGRPQCRNKDWLHISVSYTDNCARTIRRASRVHSFLRSFVYRFLPEAPILQQQRKQAKAILMPKVMARRKARFEAQQAGQSYKGGNDAVGWFEYIAQGRPYDHVSAQLSLSTAVIHTTSSTLLTVMYDILRHPELITPEEVAKAVTEDGGWCTSYVSWTAS